jgi:hypothetical protein
MRLPITVAPSVGQRLLHQIVVDAGLPARQPMLLAKASDGKSPLVQPFAALPQRFLQRLIGPATKPSTDFEMSSVSTAIEPPRRVCS